MISNREAVNPSTRIHARIHDCMFAGACPACLHEEPCPPLIVLAVLETESRHLPDGEGHRQSPDRPA